MKKILKVFFLAIFFLLFKSNFAQEVKQVEIAGTQHLKIYSSIVDQDYDLYINIPRFFNDTSRTFPVIYLLDAQWDFPLLNAIYGEQYFDGFLPEAITVGITWGGENPNYDDLRRRDFTPTKIKDTPYSGGSEKFLSFIKEELIPFIDSKFRTKPNEKTLMGSSLGGLFTLYAMFYETKLFNRYVLTSPAIDWDNGILSSFEKKYFETGSEIPTKLFMAIGGYEDVVSFQKFADNLREKKYKGLELKTLVLDGIGHSGSKAEGYTRGLQYVFEKKRVILSDEVLETYVGIYQAGFELAFRIYKEDHNLVAEVPGNPKMILYAMNESDFYAAGQYYNAHFAVDDSGNVTGYRVESYDGEKFVNKIK